MFSREYQASSQQIVRSGHVAVLDLNVRSVEMHELVFVSDTEMHSERPWFDPGRPSYLSRIVIAVSRETDTDSRVTVSCGKWTKSFVEKGLAVEDVSFDEWGRTGIIDMEQEIYRWPGPTRFKIHLRPCKTDLPVAKP